MNRSLRAIAAAITLAAPLAAFPRDVPLPVRAALAKAAVPLSAASIVVEPADGGPTLVANREHVAANPASVMKLVTTYAALDLLGPAFTFRTDVLLAGELRDGVLHGDLVLRGGGDPKLTYERLWQMAHRLRARGLREIRGDVVVDRRYFMAVPRDAARFDSEPRRAYNALPDALLVNFDAVDFTFVPEEGRVRVVGEPDLPNVEITSRIRPVEGPCASWRHGVHYDIAENGLIATVAFSGTYPRDCAEKQWALRVFDDARFLESVFRWVWAEAGGKLLGKVRDGATPEGARLFDRELSDPLASLVRDMNKFSNNVMARHIFLALSAEPAAGDGNAAGSVRIVKDWLAGKGIDAPELVLENGSGLSRDERVSAATLAALLRSVWSSGFMPELAASLPLFAEDGTFATRPAGNAMGRAHVKGGTLAGVQSLAGYVADRSGRRWIVVMLINHPNANAAQDALDALVEWVSGLGAKRAAERRK